MFFSTKLHKINHLKKLEHYLLMDCLEISLIGAACGKNQYESREKIILLQLCKENPDIYKKCFTEDGTIVLTEEKSNEIELLGIYKKYRSEVTCPSKFEEVKEKIVNEMNSKKIKNENFVDSITDNFKKDCGKNNESKIIEIKNYKRGNNKIWYFTSINGWKLKGLHDATEGDVVIEIKTRMKRENVRKNTYDLYQLFGYLLVMKKSRGKIIQKYKNEIFDSDLETDQEWGMIDINGNHSQQFKDFYTELNDFFDEVKNYKAINYDYSKVISKKPIAKIDSNGNVYDIISGFEKIVKTVMV